MFCSRARSTLLVRVLRVCALAVVLSCAGTRPSAVEGQRSADYVLEEAFGVSHPKQIVEFDAGEAIDPALTALVDSSGSEVPYQLLEGGRKLAVQTSLPAGARRTWTRLPGRKLAASGSDLVQVRQGDRYYEITNGLIGVRVVRPNGDQDGTPAPVQGLRMRDGTWTAQGPNKLSVKSNRTYRVALRFAEKGPLRVVAEVSYEFDRPEYMYGRHKIAPAGRGFYTSLITVEAGQPSILFEETTDMDLSYTLDLYEALRPTHARYRGHHASATQYGYEVDGRTYRQWHTRPAVDAQVDLRYDRPMRSQYVSTEDGWRWMAVWDPWVYDGGWYWQMFDARGPARANLVGIFAGRASRALGAASSGVGIYTNPARDGSGRQAGLTIQSHRRSADARVFPRTRFQWGLFLGTNADLAPPEQIQPVNRQMNLYAGFGLTKIRRYQLQFPDPPRGYGSPYMDMHAVERLRKRLRSDARYLRQLWDEEPSSRALMELWTDATGGKTRSAVTSVSDLARDLLDALVNGEGIYSQRFHYWHGGLEMIRKGLWIDQLLASAALTADERGRVKAAAALFASVLWDDDFVPLFDGHGLNLGTANMPIQQQGYRAFYALLLAEHPGMQQRAEEIPARVENVVKTIINEHGAPIGSPHYVGASFGPTLNTLLQVKELGGRDPFRTEPRLAKFAAFYLNLLTPPEPRVGGRRAFISLGDGSTEPSELYGVLGTGFRHADANLSARLMGAWQAVGRPHSGFFGTTLLKIDGALPVADPRLEDATFPGYYTVLRYGWGTPDESAVWVVNGDFYTDHRHADHGSVVIYALGTPLSIDWGSLYTPQAAGSYLHSAVVMEHDLDHPWDQDAPPLSSGRGWTASSQETFVTSPEGAHVRSRFTRSGTTWTRAITLIHVDPSHPILVIRDTFEGAGAASPKIMTLNQMAIGEVGTPTGLVRPPLRSHPVAGHDPKDPTHQRPSVTPPLTLHPGVTRFEFTGRYGVDWNVYNVATVPQQALIGNWSVTPWGGFITDESESQHILRMRGTGTFTSVIVPWRKGGRPSGLSVTLEGDAIVVTAGTTTARIAPTGYFSTTSRGTVERTFGSN